MSLACASRFAVLKLEDDDVVESSTKKNTSAVKGPDNSKTKANTKVSGSENKTKSKKKKKCSNEIAELQNLAFGNNNSKSKLKATGQVNVIQPNLKQWEEWKQKDSELVSEAYEQDLQEAILLSKIDYEEKKDIYEALRKEGEQSKQVLNKKKKKNNQKNGKMSLNEFQHLSNASCIQKGQNNTGNICNSTSISDTEFVKKIEDMENISNEHKKDQFRSMNPAEESARLRQYQEELRKKEEEITALNETICKLRDELKNVKSRNKKLYGILESGEMREKAEILVEVDQLVSVRDELTEELSEYHTALEQERSKVHSLQMELKKCQNTKKQRTESK